MTSTPAKVIAVRLWGTNTSDCDELAAMAISALTEAGFEIIRQADGCGCFVCPLPARAVANEELTK